MLTRVDVACPNCNATDFVPSVAENFHYRYGGGVSNFRCTECGSVIRGVFSVLLILEKASISDKESDW